LRRERRTEGRRRPRCWRAPIGAPSATEKLRIERRESRLRSARSACGIELYPTQISRASGPQHLVPLGLTLGGSKPNCRISGCALSGLRLPLPASIAINSPPKNCPKKPATRRSPAGAGYKACLFPDVFRTAAQHWSGPANAARCLDGSSGSAVQFHRRAVRAASGQGQDGNSTRLSQGLQDYVHLSRTLHGDIQE
jgi:hypothetical protein